MDRIMIVLVVLHLLTSLVYAWDWYQDYDRWQESLIRLVISLFLPLVGVLLCKMVDYFAEHNASAQMDELYLGRGGDDGWAGAAAAHRARPGGG